MQGETGPDIPFSWQIAAKSFDKTLFRLPVELCEPTALNFGPLFELAAYFAACDPPFQFSELLPANDDSGSDLDGPTHDEGDPKEDHTALMSEGQAPLSPSRSSPPTPVRASSVPSGVLELNEDAIENEEIDISDVEDEDEDVEMSAIEEEQDGEMVEIEERDEEEPQAPPPATRDTKAMAIRALGRGANPSQAKAKENQKAVKARRARKDTAPLSSDDDEETTAPPPTARNSRAKAIPARAKAQGSRKAVKASTPPVEEDTAHGRPRRVRTASAKRLASELDNAQETPGEGSGKRQKIG